MNNAEQIGKMLEGLGFVPQAMNKFFQVKGYVRNFQKWETFQPHAEVIRRDKNHWEIMERYEDSMSWHKLYSGPATPSLIRSILEVNELIEKPETTLTELSKSISLFQELLGTKGSNTYPFYQAAHVVVSAAKAYLAEERDRIYGLETNSTVDLSTATGLKGSFTDQNSFGLVEKPRTFREKLADLMEEEGVELEVSLQTRMIFEGLFDENGNEISPNEEVSGVDVCFLQGESPENAVEFLDMDKYGFTITPEMLREKAEETQT